MSPSSALPGTRAAPRVAAALPARWRLLESRPADGAENMAMDHALMDHARRSGDVLMRVYGWSRATLSLGRHQPARGRYDRAAADALGVAFVRRPTGGRALLHARELTYCIAAPALALGGPRESYSRMNRLLITALRRMGVAAVAVRGRGRAPRPGTAPCFSQPVDGEITVLGRKLAGSAQWRERGAMMQHGSILVDDDQAIARALLVDTSDASPPDSVPATLREVLGRAPAPSELVEALRGALSDEERVCALPMDCEPQLERAARVLIHHYESEPWTWRA